MAKRVEGKVAIVVGGGQTAGESIGNGRATAILLAREGAQVVVADLRLESAQETVAMIRAEQGEATALQADATNEESLSRLIASTLSTYGKLNILHNNVGASVSTGDAPATDITMEAYDRSLAMNLKSALMSSKHAMPALRETHGSIVNISSMSAIHANPLVGYKTTKLALIGLTEHLAAENAKFGVRANAILPGAMNTPMAIEPRVALGINRAELIAARDRRVPLGGKMGSAWDVAYAALFLHSDEAGFITGIALVVDGGEQVCK